MTEALFRTVSYTKNYVLIGLLLVASFVLSRLFLPLLTQTLPAMEQGTLLIVFFELVLLFVFGFFAYELAKPTIIPSFVLAIFIGMLERDTLAVLTQNSTVLTILTTLGAAFILFGGGLDTPFTRFRSLLKPIMAIAFVGTILTAFLFSLSLGIVSTFFGATIPIGAAVIVGAALASTDPAAIIPSFKSLTFLRPRVKYIAVSESALNDVVGAVLTGVFLALFAVGVASPESLFDAYHHLLTAHVAFEVVKELVLGAGVGVLGFLILHGWSRAKVRMSAGGEADAALFLAVPLFCYLLAVAMGGSGFLAVFISSLLFHLEDHFSHVEHYFNHTIEGFMKPLIFMLLGAVVDFQDLLSVAPLGIAMGIVFMFIIRPLVVFGTLWPFMRGTEGMSARELWFLSFVRETGVIPAVLLMNVKASGIEGADTVVAVGLWVILLTLVVQPPLTPFIAKQLGIAKDVAPFPRVQHRGPVAVLCSRGDSWMNRMPSVIDWADTHSVENIVLLHCPEHRWNEALSKDAEAKAAEILSRTNVEREAEGKKPVKFEFIGRPGLLQDNIESLLKTNDVSIVFVGSKMLDYRLEDVKRLQVPFVFVA